MKKFDFVVGNPPYQEETISNPKGNNQKRTKNIFPLFQEQADKISNISSVLIYPGARWIHRSGKGTSTFGLEQINDSNLSTLIYYPDASEVFEQVQIFDGISIVSKVYSKKDKGFKYIYKNKNESLSIFSENPGDNLLPLYPKDNIINNKIEQFVKNNNLRFIHDRVLPQKFFGIESNFIEDNLDKSRPLSGNENTINYDTEIKLFANDKSGKAGRTKWFIVNKNLIEKNKEFIKKWKVVVSSANAGGQKRDNQIEIIDNKSAFARSRVGLGMFETEKEAINFFNYCNSYIIRYCFLMTDENLSSLAKRVPDILDYTSKNQFVDFDKNTDKQLKKLMTLSSEEMEYIVTRVDSIRSSKND